MTSGAAQRATILRGATTREVASAKGAKRSGVSVEPFDQGPSGTTPRPISSTLDPRSAGDSALAHQGTTLSSPKVWMVCRRGSARRRRISSDHREQYHQLNL